MASRFEWVVLLCGCNDMVALLCRRSYETRRDIVASTLENPSANPHRPYYGDLALARTLGEIMRKPQGLYLDKDDAWLVTMRQKRQAALKARAVQETPHEELQAVLVRYRENLGHIVNACRRQNQRLVMMTQPIIHHKDMPHELERLTWLISDDDEAYTSAVLEQLMDGFNQAMITVCRQRGIDCIDLAARLPKDTTVFWDDVHFNIPGCAKVADIAALTSLTN